MHDDGRASWVERATDRVPFLEKELFLLRRIVQPGMVCVDVGAAGGAHLVVMARQVGPTGHVIGIEPRPGAVRLVRTVARVAGVGDRVTLVQGALSAGPGHLTLRIPIVPTRAHLPGTTQDPGGTAAFGRLPSRQITVPTAALDDIVDAAGVDRVDVIKIDVEGAELVALAGAHDTLRRYRPLVLVEADDLHQVRYDATAQDVVDLVVDHGYEVYRYRRGALDALDGRVVPDEDDYLFVPVERTPPLAVRHRQRVFA